MWIAELPNGSLYLSDGVFFRWLVTPDDVGTMQWVVTEQGGNPMFNKVATWHQMGVPADLASANAAGAPWPANAQ